MGLNWIQLALKHATRVWLLDWQMIWQQCESVPSVEIIELAVYWRAFIDHRPKYKCRQSVHSGSNISLTLVRVSRRRNYTKLRNCRMVCVEKQPKANDFRVIRGKITLAFFAFIHGLNDISFYYKFDMKNYNKIWIWTCIIWIRRYQTIISWTMLIASYSHIYTL